MDSCPDGEVVLDEGTNRIVLDRDVTLPGDRWRLHGPGRCAAATNDVRTES